MMMPITMTLFMKCTVLVVTRRTIELPFVREWSGAQGHGRCTAVLLQNIQEVTQAAVLLRHNDDGVTQASSHKG